MLTPQILPWVAAKAGISEALALKLWRRASGEAERLTGSCRGAEYCRVAMEHFLSLAEAESPQQAAFARWAAEPRLTWFWRYQSRMSQLSLLAAQNSCRFWQQTLNDLYQPREAA